MIINVLIPHVNSIISLFIYHRFLLILFFVTPISNTLSSSHSSSAICFLTRRPIYETVQFATELAQNLLTIDVFILVDDNTISLLSENSPYVQYLQFNESICTQTYFQDANILGITKPCSAWDKALYYFSKAFTNHSFVWFIEDDVFIPSVQAFSAIHELYSSSYDLITTDVQYNLNGNYYSWYHWGSARGTFPLPWAHGMVCAVGCSRRLLTAVDEYVQWRGHLTFIEFLFHTIAIQDTRMKIVTPLELNTIVYRKKYRIEQVQTRPNNWWHPRKNHSYQQQWRHWLNRNNSFDEHNFVTSLNSIEEQLSNKNTKVGIEKQMMKLIDEFELIKGQLDSSIRRQLRDRFLSLAINQSNTITNIAKLLADHAFMLPKHRNITYKKTVRYLQLETALEDNKQMILQLIGNDHLTADETNRMNWLRVETTRLILAMTYEIQCKIYMIRCNKLEQWFDIDLKTSQYSQLSFLSQLFLLNIIFLCVIFICFRLKFKTNRK